MTFRITFGKASRLSWLTGTQRPPFGAFVSLLPGKDGLLHISKLRSLAGGKRVEAVEDVVSVGQKLQVQIAEIDDRGKLSLVPVVDEDSSSEDAEDSDQE